MTLPDSIRPFLDAVAEHCDARLVGNRGNQGFRRSTPLGGLVPLLDRLSESGDLVPDRCRFLDMGCADGRVNLFLSGLVERSVGIEIDDFTLDDHVPLREGVESALADRGLPPLTGNVDLILGDTLAPDLDRRLRNALGLGLADFDIFFTYITLHDEFARIVNEAARPGAIYVIYGLDLVLPRFVGLILDEGLTSRAEKIAVYRKVPVRPS